MAEAQDSVSQQTIGMCCKKKREAYSARSWKNWLKAAAGRGHSAGWLLLQMSQGVRGLEIEKGLRDTGPFGAQEKGVRRHASRRSGRLAASASSALEEMHTAAYMTRLVTAAGGEAARLAMAAA